MEDTIARRTIESSSIGKPGRSIQLTGSSSCLARSVKCSVCPSRSHNLADALANVLEMEKESPQIDSEIGPLPTFRLAVSHDPVVAPIAVSMLFNLLTHFGINRHVIGRDYIRFVR